MIVVNDYSNLSPEEARAKIIHLTHRIFTEQFHHSFFVKDPRPEYYLKYEIQAFLDGRISEFHGWNDPLGQALDFFYERLTWWFRAFWDWTMKPGIEWILDGFRWIWDSAVYWAREAYNRILSVRDWLLDLWYVYIRPGVSAIVGGFKWLWEQAANFAQDAVTWARNAYNTIQQAWSGIVEQVSGAFEALSKQMAALPQAIGAAFQSAITYIYEPLKKIWDDVLVPFAETIKDKALELINSASNWLYEHLLGFVEWLRGIGPITPDRAYSLIPHMFKLGFAAAGGLYAAHVVGELLHPLKEMGYGHLAAIIYKFSNYDTISGAILGALAATVFRTPLTYFFNAIFQPRLPSTEEAGEFWRRGLIDDEGFMTIARYQGFSEFWAEKFLKTKEKLPSVDEATRMYWRGVLSEEDLKKLISDQGFRGKYADGFFELRKALPSPSDLVRFVVREVALMPPDYPTPQFFLDAMKKWGYDDYWARAYWWSHWELPAFGQLQEAYFRGIITESELKQFIKWHDYSPDPRPGISKSDLEIMFELIFKMPDKLDARWMRRWGIINSEEHKQLLKAEGLHPDWLDRVALAERMNMLADERTEIKSALRSQYLVGMITAQVLQQKLREIFYTPEETEFLIRAAEERYKYELMKDAIDAAKYNYRLGKITLEELSKQLYDLGLSAEKVQKIVMIEAARAIEARREAYGESVYIYGRDVVIRRFREGLTTPTELESELRMIGYSDRQIPHLRTVALLERDYDFAMTVLSYVKTAYRKKKIDDTRFIEILRSFGFTDDKISLELSLLKLAYGLGLEEEEVAS